VAAYAIAIWATRILDRHDVERVYGILAMRHGALHEVR
jgi:hypothetical protein